MEPAVLGGRGVIEQENAIRARLMLRRQPVALDGGRAERERPFDGTVERLRPAARDAECRRDGGAGGAAEVSRRAVARAVVALLAAFADPVAAHLALARRGAAVAGGGVAVV